MKSVRGYIKRSTGETDPTRATMVAIKLLGELEHRSANDQPLSAKRFKDVAAAYLRDAHTRWKEGRNSQGRYNIIRGTLNRYHVPYFGTRDITKIKKNDRMDYRAWRQDYWITGPGKDLTIYHKVRPSSATLKQEWTILRWFREGKDARHRAERELITPVKLLIQSQPNVHGQCDQGLYADWTQ